MELEPSRKTFVIKSLGPEPGAGDADAELSSTPNPRRKHFEIKSVAPEYELPDCTHVSPAVVADLSADLSPNADRRYRLYFTVESFRQIEDHIGWGRRTADNDVEQGGILLGESYRDSKEELIYVIVRESISGRKARGSGAYLAMTHETWAEMLSQVDKIVDANPDSKLRIVGWYHTHPNNLDVFMSGTDRNTQRAFFPYEWQFAVVLNPHKTLWRVYNGARSEQCAGYVIEGSLGLKSARPDALRQSGTIPPLRESSGLAAQLVPPVSSKVEPAQSVKNKKWRNASPWFLFAFAFYALAVTALAAWLWHKSLLASGGALHDSPHIAASPGPLQHLSQEERSRFEHLLTILARLKTVPMSSNTEAAALGDIEATVRQILSSNTLPPATRSKNEKAEISHIREESFREEAESVRQVTVPSATTTDSPFSGD